MPDSPLTVNAMGNCQSELGWKATVKVLSSDTTGIDCHAAWYAKAGNKACTSSSGSVPFSIPRSEAWSWVSPDAGNLMPPLASIVKVGADCSAAGFTTVNTTVDSTPAGSACAPTVSCRAEPDPVAPAKSEAAGPRSGTFPLSVSPDRPDSVTTEAGGTHTLGTTHRVMLLALRVSGLLCFAREARSDGTATRNGRYPPASPRSRSDGTCSGSGGRVSPASPGTPVAAVHASTRLPPASTSCAALTSVKVKATNALAGTVWPAATVSFTNSAPDDAESTARLWNAAAKAP
mmetsp:Transcript_53448/g.141726  ORF Transcript_53448/g.141726 Transcript_53448/m.141726 type:complete len:290 (+) Transcript_53448:4547-5416(+)